MEVVGVLGHMGMWMKCVINIHNLYKFYKMQNKPPLILTPSAVNTQNPKYKFWQTSIAGNQRSPKNMSLVTASDITNSNEQMHQNEHEYEGYAQGEKLEILSQGLRDGDDGKSESEAAPSQEDSQHLKIKQMEQQIQRLRVQIQQGRLLNQNLLKELNKTTNELRVAQTLNTQLNEECDRLYTNVKAAHDRHSEVQNQKMELLIQISTLNQTKQLAVNKSEILEEQVQYLNKKIQSLYEQITFQKSISSDLNRQSMVLKQQLNKMMGIMHDYSELQKEVARTHAINNEIQDRVIRLEEELKSTRLQVEESEKNQENYAQEQNRLFLRIQELENGGNVLAEKLTFAESKLRHEMQESEARQNQQNQCQPRYVKILEEYEKRNSDLIFEVVALNDRNLKLIEQRDFYMRRVQAIASNRNERLPYDQFVSLLKASNDEVQLYRRKVSLKQDQLQQLQTKYDHETLNLQQKIRQLTNILQIRQHEKQTQKHLIQNQIQIYKKDCEMMMRRNEELKSMQVKLRLEVMEKDRIIIQFVERQKVMEESRVRNSNHL